MSKRNFFELLKNKWSENKFVCVGLDSDFEKIPIAAHRRTDGRHTDTQETILFFNQKIIDSTKDLVCAYKPNIAFYIKYGADGLNALQSTIVYINTVAPDVPIILDAKYADIGNTNIGYVNSTFDYMSADAITVNPYLGAEALQPFLDLKDKGIIVLCRTSNSGAGEFQDLIVNHVEPLYQVVARNVANNWNKNGNCMIVIGATYPEELSRVRKMVGDLPVLIPGIGAQGGDLKKAVKAGKDSNNQGMVINFSRSVVFASKNAYFADVARQKTQESHDQINQYLQ